jgi:hypothetical protein
MMGRVWTVAALVACFAAAPAFAQGTAEQREACEADAYRFCPYDIPNVDAIEACLKKYIRSISPACQQQFGYVETKAKRRSAD